MCWPRALGLSGSGGYSKWGSPEMQASGVHLIQCFQELACVKVGLTDLKSAADGKVGNSALLGEAECLPQGRLSCTLEAVGRLHETHPVAGLHYC